MHNCPRMIVLLHRYVVHILSTGYRSIIENPPEEDPSVSTRRCVYIYLFDAILKYLHILVSHIRFTRNSLYVLSIHFGLCRFIQLINSLYWNQTARVKMADTYTDDVEIIKLVVFG